MDVHEIGNRIKLARQLRNYTLDDIANEIGVAKSTIQRYENGLINKIKLPVLQAIADSLNVNPSWLSGKDVPMVIDESLYNIIKTRLDELKISLEEVAEKSRVSLYWLQSIDTFIPGQLGEEMGYDWITRVADAIGLPSSKLRAALAKQEAPVYEGPRVTADEAFKQAQEDFKASLGPDIIKSFISVEEQKHLTKYRNIDDKGKHTVDTILEMEYNRCKLCNENIAVLLPQEDKSHLEPQAAHERTDIEITDKMRKQDDDIMNDDELWNK